MTWTRAHIIVGTAIVGAAIWSGHQAVTEPIAGTALVAPMTACWFEDGGPLGPDRPQATPCLWNGATMGNRTGESFILWADPYPVDPALAPPDSSD